LGVDAPPGLTWSDAVREADWIAERLSPPDTHLVSSIVPNGFEAYARCCILSRDREEVMAIS